jgi:hypothetical protein
MYVRKVRCAIIKLTIKKDGEIDGCQNRKTVLHDQGSVRSFGIALQHCVAFDSAKGNTSSKDRKDLAYSY